MEKKKFLSLITAAVLTLSLAGCANKTESPDDGSGTDVPRTKETTTETVGIKNIPEDKKELVNLLDSAIDYLDVYAYSYDKSVICEVKNVSVGKLSSVSNAAEAFRSVFGERELYDTYNYSSAPESFKGALIDGDFEDSDIKEISASSPEKNAIEITAKLADVSNPQKNNMPLVKIGTEFLTPDDVKTALNEFSSSASSVSVAVKDITVKVKINAVDSSLISLTVSFSQSFSLGGVKLVETEGAGVTGSSDTKIVFNNIGQEKIG